MVSCTSKMRWLTLVMSTVSAIVPGKGLSSGATMGGGSGTGCGPGALCASATVVNSRQRAANAAADRRETNGRATDSSSKVNYSTPVRDFAAAGSGRASRECGWVFGYGRFKSRKGGGRFFRLFTQSLEFAENFLQQSGGLRGRIGADFLFFLRQFVEQPVESFAGDIAIKVEILVADQAARRRAIQKLIELLDEPDVLHRVMNDGREGLGQVWRRDPLEIVRRRGVAAGQDLAGIREGHLEDGIKEDGLGRGRSLLGRAVHGQLQIVDLRAHAEHAHTFADALQVAGQQDLDGF